MSTSDADRWKTLSAHFDRAVDLPSAERASYVDDLRAGDPALACDLQEWLAAHDASASERFLENSAPAPGGPLIAAGQTYGAYTLLSPIGQGGMGSVWLAERVDGRFERKVAIKFLHRELIGRGGEERFRREGSVLASLSHPGIAQLMDAGVTPGGQPYLVIEYVDGEPIDRYCDARRLRIDERLELFLEVLNAVSHAHAHLVVHRDLKPSNVLVTTDGQVKLLDFGISKLIEAGEQARTEALLTRVGGWAMTPEYAAPEQVTGGVISTATDVYSLSVMLYVLLCGRHPIAMPLQTPMDIVKAVVETAPPQMSEGVTGPRARESAAEIAERRNTTPDRLEIGLKGDLDTIVRKALRKDPAERYRTAPEFADDIRRFLNHQPISARADSVAYRAAKFVRRNRIAVTLASLTFVAIVAGVIGTLSQARTAHIERDYALKQLARAEALNDLNHFLLTDAAPSGKPLAVNELLKRAEQIVSRQTAGSAETRADLLLAIGSQYASMDEIDKSRRVLESARTLAWKTTDPSIRARASCALGRVMAKSDEPQRAVELIQEGTSEIPADERFTLERVYCLRQSSYVAREAAETSDAIAQALAAQQLLASSPFRSELQDLTILVDIAESYSQAGKMAEAIPAFEQASQVMNSLGRGETQKAGTLYNNWALSLDASGRPLDAEPIYRRAVEISRADASDDAVSPMLQINFARTLGRLGKFDEATRHAEAGYDKARTAGFEVVVNQSLLLRSSLYRQMGNLGRSTAMLDEVEPRMRAALPPGHLGFGGLMAEQALLAQAKGESARAAELIDGAYAIAETARVAGGARDLAPRLLLRRAEIRNAAGQFADAIADAKVALEQFKQVLPQDMLATHRGDAYLAMADAHRGLGEIAEASLAYASALRHLESALGVDHPRVREIREKLHALAAPQTATSAETGAGRSG